jgi:acyl carrier protein
LGIARAEPDTDFFAWGGDGLKAIKLCMAVKESFGLPCPAGDIFRTPTPRELARRLEEARLAGRELACAGEDQREDDFGSGTLSEEELSLLRDMVDE